MFRYAYKLKNKFQLEKEGIGNIFWGGFQIPLKFKMAENFLV